MARLLYYVFPYRKKVMRRQLQLVFPEYNAHRIKILMIRNYRHLVLFLFEFMKLMRWSNRKIEHMAHVTNKEVLDTLKSGGLLLTGHMGNWEIFARWLSINNYPLSVIMKKQKNRKINDLISTWRSEVGMKTIYTGGGMTEALKSIKNSEIVCIVGDQDARKRGVFSNFLGQMSSTHTGAAKIAYLTQCPVVVGCGIRDKFGSYHSEIKEMDVSAIRSQSKSQDEFIQLFVDEYNRILGEMIMKYPEQYFWFHKRWKTPYNGTHLIDYS